MTPKELETYLLLHEQKVQGFVTTRSRNWLIAAGIAFVIFIVLVVVIFKHRSPTNETYEGQIRTLDSTIKYQQKNIESLQKYNNLQDSAIQTLDEAYRKNRPTETRIIHSYEQIPIRVRDLSNDSLRREITEFK